MRVLILHSRYRSGDSSGENRVVDDEAHLLQEAGHDVHAWQPEPLESGAGGLARLRLGTRAVWSSEATAQVRVRLKDHRPDVVHCHNLFPMLSPSVLRAAAGHAVPVLLTLHNYRLLCLPATLLRDGSICEACVGRLPWRGVVYRCYRGSAPASAALAASLALHRLAGTFERVRLFLAVSRFARDKHVEAGLPRSRIRVKPNFAWSSPRREGPGAYFLYLGRLSAEKGLSTLLNVWRPAWGRLLVVGDGPERERVRAAASSQVELRGSVPALEVPALIRGARAVVVPSLWYEGAPRVVVEAYAAGVPVLSSSIGGLPDFVRHETSGLLVTPGDSAAWASAVERLCDNAESERLGEGAWKLWHESYTPERALGALEAAYREAGARSTTEDGS